MRSICLVSCVSKKLNRECTAQYFYCSTWFKLASIYARTFDCWWILSAKHGLCDPRTTLTPYNETLRGKKKSEREKWSINVYESLLCSDIERDSQITILAGNMYREFLETWLIKDGFNVSVPLRGLGIGQQLQALNRINSCVV